MTTNNRSITTGHNPKEATIVLEFIKAGTFNGKDVKAGDTITCSRSEAKKYLSVDKSMVKIMLD